jgi:hypothetical protein
VSSSAISLTDDFGNQIDILGLHEGGSAHKHSDDSKDTGSRSAHPNTYNTYRNISPRDGAEITPYVMNTTVDDAMVTAAGTLVPLAGTLSSSTSAAGLPEPEHMS